MSVTDFSLDTANEVTPAPLIMTVDYKDMETMQPSNTAWHIEKLVNRPDIDIRLEPRPVRNMLCKGIQLQLQFNGHYIATIPFCLLRCAARFLLPITGQEGEVIELPPNIDARGVQILTQHLWDIALATQPQRLEGNMSIYDSLAVCQAAYLMGLTRYTNHVFKRMDVYFSSHVPSYEEMDAVLYFGATHWRLWANMTHKLAHAVRDERIQDADVFARFCLERPVLNDALVETMEALDMQEAFMLKKKAEEQERREEGSVKRGLERERRKQEREHVREQQMQRKKAVDERRAADQKRREHASAMRQACLAKTRASGKDRVMTAEEKKWYVKEFGKQPPRGC